MGVVGWWLCLMLAQQTPAQPQPVDPELRARFSVTVRASDAVTARVYEYLGLIAKRNVLKSRFGTPGTPAELELVLLFEERPKMPWNRRDIGTVNLRINPEADTALVEYCLRHCLEQNPELVTYRSSLNEFLKRLDAASAALSRRYK